MAIHVLKVQRPYFEHLVDGTKRFEVRRNDRGYQRGDLLILEAFDGIYRDPEYPEPMRAEVTFVYSGDPRFGQWPTGVVVLGIEPVEASR